MLLIDIARIHDALGTVGGFPCLRPGAITAWIDDNVREKDRHEAWCQAQRQWFWRLRPYLGHHYDVHESPHILLLSKLPAPHAALLLDDGEKALRATESCLASLLDVPRVGKYPVIAFPYIDEMIRYLLPYYADVRSAPPLGMCIRVGQVHAVLDLDRTGRATLAHELAHAYLSPLSLPHWLEEAVVQRMERIALGGVRLWSDQELRQEHHGYWTKQGLGSFWSGRGFYLPAAQARFHYALAEFILDQIAAGDTGARFADFLHSAQRSDAGEGAARQYLGRSLSDYIARFLGPGNWTPPAQADPPTDS